MDKNQIRPLKKEEEFDVKKILTKFLVQWKLYVISFIVFIALAFLFILYATPMYKVHAQVLVEDNSSKGSSSSSSSSFAQTNMLEDFSGMFDLQNNVYNEMSILKTNDLLQKTISKLHLNIAYYKKHNIRTVELFNKNPYTVGFIPISDSISLTEFEVNFPDSGKSSGFTISNSDNTFKITANFDDTINSPVGKFCLARSGMPFTDKTYSFTVNSIDAVIADIQKNLLISIPDDQTTVIQLDYNTNVPRKGEIIEGQLINEYMDRNLREKNEISDSTIAFINSRIGLVSGDLSGIETDIEHFKQQNNLADIEAQSQQLVQNTSTYYQKLNEAEVQLTVIQSMLDYLMDDKNNNRPVPALLTADPTFLQLMQQYNALVLQRERLSLTVKENNPIASNLNTQIKNVRGDLIKSLQSQQKAMSISKDKLAQQNKQMAGAIQNVPVQERQYVDLSREKDVKQALYLYLLQKKEETAITRASNLPNASIIQQPKSEYLPYFPSNILIGSAAFLLAFILPTGFIILKQLFSNRIISRDDITNETNIPIIAEVGHYDGEGILNMKVGGRTPVAEQFRVFRTNMDFLTKQNNNPVILITSTISGEGKSFISSSLASVYAYSGKKVLLMEMDLRKPKLSAMLGLPNESGFTSYIINNKPITEYIKPLKQVPNVFFLNSGLVPPNPAELLMSDKMETFFSDLKNEFDIIIMDTAPIGVVTDAQLLSKYSDANLYVMRQGYSFKNSVEFINEVTETDRMSNLYIVVNDVKKGNSYRYGYSYGYGYGYGYVDDGKKRKLFKSRK
jgi:tyrosine-protein kinase Etk/Wzc